MTVAGAAAGAGRGAGEDGLAPRPPLVVVGSIHYDVVLRLPRLPGPNDRLTPTEATLTPGGMGGNVATAVARLGGRVRFGGSFAGDEDGAALRADLARERVDVDLAGEQLGAESSRGVILVGEDGERAIVAWTGLLADLERAPGQPPGLVRAVERRRWPRGPVRLADGLFAPPVSGLYCPAALAPLVLSQVPPDLPLFVDVETGHLDCWDEPAVRAVLRRAAVVFGNDANLTALAIRLGGAAAGDLARAVGGVLAVTRGRAGCVVCWPDGRLAIPAFPVAAVDTTGAGDCFAGAFVLGTLRGWPPERAARYANAAAALSTRRLGARTGMPTAAEVAALLAGSGWVGGGPEQGPPDGSGGSDG